MKSALLTFDCPDCDHALHAYLNVSASRLKGDNEVTCTNCGNRIVITIDIMGGADRTEGE